MRIYGRDSNVNLGPNVEVVYLRIDGVDKECNFSKDLEE